MKKYNFKKILITASATALFGQVYINPFNTDFRFTIGVIVLTVLILKFKDLPIVITTIVTGIAVVAFRIGIGYLSGLPFNELIQIYYPSFVFYLTYGLLIQIFSIRDIVNQPILLITFLGFCDVFANVIEAAMRYEFINVTAKIVLPSLFVVGFLRAFIIFLMNLGLVFYNIIILKDENNDKIKEFLMLSSKMRTESFFLKKGMNDIENAMNKSYYLYNQMTDLCSKDVTDDIIYDLKQEILELSKDIHEVKKDNERVVAGIEKIIPVVEQMDEMRFDEIIQMLKENTENLAKMQGKEILLRESIIFKNLSIKNYYPMITILINLLSNAVDAIDNYGMVRIEQNLDNDFLVIDIIDNGKGLKNSEKNIIFEPGYSTKFDKKTGKMSSGIGLTHVKTLIQDDYSGEIDLVSNEDENTRFRIKFLKAKL